MEINRIKTRKFAAVSSLAMGLLVGGSTIAQAPAPAPPPVTVNGTVHPNIANAQKLIAEAYEYIIAAQKANNYDMQNHAVIAESDLTAASQQLNLAAQASEQKK